MGISEQNKLASKKFDLMLFSIGHSNHTSLRFLELLQSFGISCVVDVRSTPFSKYHPQFSKISLTHDLFQHNIEYVWMGDTLGGRRQELQNSVDLRQDDKYNADLEYHQAVVELMRKGLQRKIVMMCSEEDPRKCHRHKIISQTLIQKQLPECHKLQSIEIIHIRGDGTFENASSIPFSFQLSLFD